MDSDSSCNAFFVYGTLRYDDNTNKPWTKIFNTDSISEKSKFYGAVMYELNEGYPAIIFQEVLFISPCNYFICKRETIQLLVIVLHLII